MQRSFHLWFQHPNNIQITEHIMKHSLSNFSPISCYRRTSIKSALDLIIISLLKLLTIPPH
jgi:hypothetical protein